MSKLQFVPQLEPIAREAGALLMSYFGKISIEYKGDADLVTEADRAASASSPSALLRSGQIMT